MFLASVVGGRYAGAITFGSIPMTSNAPNGFVAMVDSAGTWMWVQTETSGSVFGFHSAPGTNTRIYATGDTDTGASFGSHQVATNMGNFTGFVACLGDVALSTGSSTADLDPLTLWPNPATRVLQTSFNLQASPLRIIDPGGRSVADSTPVNSR